MVAGIWLGGPSQHGVDGEILGSKPLLLLMWLIPLWCSCRWSGLDRPQVTSLSPMERRKWEKKSTRPSFQLEIGGQEVLSVKVSCQCKVNQIALNPVISRPVSSCNPLLRRDIRGNLARLSSNCLQLLCKRAALRRCTRTKEGQLCINVGSACQSRSAFWSTKLHEKAISDATLRHCFLWIVF